MRRTSSNTRIPDKLVKRFRVSSALQSVQQVKSLVKDSDCARSSKRRRSYFYGSLDNRA